MSIDNIFALANNQMASQFQLVFPTGIPGSPALDLTDLSIRASTGPFTIPEKSHAMYQLYFRGQQGAFAAPLDETDKTLTLSIVLDDNWIIYDALDDWKEFVYNSDTGAVGSNTATRTTLQCWFYGSSNTSGESRVSKILSYEGVQIKSLKPTDPDPQSGEPTRVEATFNYIKQVRVQPGA